MRMTLALPRLRIFVDSTPPLFLILFGVTFEAILFSRREGIATDSRRNNRGLQNT